MYRIPPVLGVLAFLLVFPGPGTLEARPPLDPAKTLELSTPRHALHALGNGQIRLSSALNETVFFGGTVWAPDSMRWEAVPGSLWTFDSGVGSAIKGPGQSYPFVDPYKPDGFHAYMEGWVGLDRTFPKDPHFRRLSSLDARWHGNPCVGAAAGLGGNYSIWSGIFEDEADSMCWGAGRGYGNSWHGCLARSFSYTGGPVTFSFRYRIDAEANFDFVTVWTDTSGGADEDAQVVSFTGTMQGWPTWNLTPGSTLPSTPGPLVLKFCFDSDGSWSDEDGLNPTNCGAFVLDDIAMTGGVSYSTNFELDDGGWMMLPPLPGHGGEWSNLVALSDLPAPSPAPGCGMEDSVLVLYDPSTGGHPWYQDNLAMSPWIDLARAGATHLPGRGVQLGGYFDLPFLNYVFTIVAAQWYPDSCAGSGNIGMSAIQTTGFYYIFGGTPLCLASRDFRGQIDLTGLVPPYATQLRIGIGAIDYCWWAADCSGGSNSTPWFDNIRFFVHSGRTLQDGLDLAAEGDTIWVGPGIYRGPEYRNLTFRGKKLVLKSMNGPEQTIIDCGSSGRGFIFDSGEDSLTVVDGFTILNGQAPPDAYGDEYGGGIFIGGNSSPTIRDCIISSCTANRYGGGIYLYHGSGAQVIDCEIHGCQSLYGGGIHAEGLSNLILQDCVIASNQATYRGGGALTRGALTLEGGAVSENSAEQGGGLFLDGGNEILLDCTISGNNAGMGGGVWMGSCGQWGCGSDAELHRCRFIGNQAAVGGGVYAYGGTFVDCLIALNTAIGTGGGAYLQGSDLEGCRIAGNSAAEGGGVAAFWKFAYVSQCYPSFPPRIDRCEITGNIASRGAGIRFERGPYHEPCPAVMIQASISGNHADTGGGVYITRLTEVDVGRSVIWGNCADSTGAGAFLAESTSVATIDCSVLDPTEWTGTGNIAYLNPPIVENPSFCLPLECTAAPDTGGVYSVSSFSPCLAGNNTCQVLIGASAEGCKVTDVEEDCLAAPAATRLTIFPNPCAGKARVILSSQREGSASVRILGIDGRLIRGFELAEGQRQIDWDGMDGLGRAVPTGVYFVEFRSGGSRETARLVLLR